MGSRSGKATATNQVILHLPMIRQVYGLVVTGLQTLPLELLNQILGAPSTSTSLGKHLTGFFWMLMSSDTHIGLSRGLTRDYNINPLNNPLLSDHINAPTSFASCPCLLPLNSAPTPPAQTSISPLPV